MGREGGEDGMMKVGYGRQKRNTRGVRSEAKTIDSVKWSTKERRGEKGSSQYDNITETNLKRHVGRREKRSR